MRNGSKVMSIAHALLLVWALGAFAQTCEPGAASGTSAETCAPSSCLPRCSTTCAPDELVRVDPALELAPRTGPSPAELGLEDLGAILEPVRAFFCVPGLGAAVVEEGELVAIAKATWKLELD